MAENILRRFSLPPFARLEGDAHGREEEVTDCLSGGSLVEGAAGPIGLNVGVGDRQVRYWLPADHPRFPQLRDAIIKAVRSHTRVQVRLDNHAHVILDATVS